MKIYKGKYLSIQLDKKNDTFILFWIKSPTSTDFFKEEMLTLKGFYKKHKPSKVLWLQDNFALKINLNTHLWIEEHINIPCAEYGNKKAAFVIGKNIMANLKVINFFESEESAIKTQHFATKKEAIKWLNID